MLLARLWNVLGSSSVPASEPKVALATGGYQVQFIPSLVDPVLDLALSQHEELRTCAVRVLATMITSQWHLEGSFSVIEAKMIDKLDTVFLTGTSAASSNLSDLGIGQLGAEQDITPEEVDQALFLPELRALFDGPDVDPRLCGAVQASLTTVSQFLLLLVSVRALPPSQASRTTLSRPPSSCSRSCVKPSVRRPLQHMFCVS